MANNARPLTVLLSGDHVLLRGFVRAWLSRFSRMQIVAEARGSSQTMSLTRKHRPTLVLMDFESHQQESVELLRKLRIVFPKVKVIVYFSTPNEVFAMKLIRAGASGFVVKTAESGDMETAIRTVLGGGVYLCAAFLDSLSGTLVRKIPGLDGRPLNRKQVALLKLIGIGLSPRAMSMGLKRTQATIVAETKVLMKRIGTRTASATMKYAGAAGLIPS